MAQKVKKVLRRELGPSAKGHVRKLLEKRRKKRQKKARAGRILGTLMAAPVTVYELQRSGYLKEGLIAIASAYAIGRVAGAAARSLTYAKRIRRATRMVGEGMAQELKSNPNSPLRELLKNYRYVVVDRHGNVKGTNRKRVLAIGRVRLESKKIFEKALPNKAD